MKADDFSIVGQSWKHSIGSLIRITILTPWPNFESHARPELAVRHFEITAFRIWEKGCYKIVKLLTDKIFCRKTVFVIVFTTELQ